MIFTQLAVQAILHPVFTALYALFCVDLRSPRAYVFLAEDDSSQSRNVPNYVIKLIFNWPVKHFSSHGLSTGLSTFSSNHF